MSTQKKQSRFQRGTWVHVAEHFKLTVASLKKNIGWKFRDPKIVEFEHTHIFHSISDSTLQPNKYCSAVGGHFHEVSLVQSSNPDDAPTLKVGPPLTTTSFTLPNGSVRKKNVPIKIAGYDDHGNEIDIVDSHTHGSLYLGFEEFTAKTKAVIRQEERQKVMSAMEGPVATQAARMTSLNEGPDKDAVRHQIRETAPEAPK